MGDYVCYGQINVDAPAEIHDQIRPLVERTSSFDLNDNGDIVHHGGTDGARGLYTEFRELINNLYDMAKNEGYDEELFLFGKIIVDFTDYDEANKIMVMAVNAEREITVFPDNT